MSGLFRFKSKKELPMNPIKLPVAELKSALTGLAKVIPKRSTLPVLGCVRIEVTADAQIQLTVTDLSTSLIVTLPSASEGEPRALLLPLEDLHNVTKSCGRGDVITITLLEKQRASIHFPVGQQMVEHLCDSLPVEEFPLIPRIAAEPIVLGLPVRQAIHRAMECASTDPTRAVLNGAYLDTSLVDAHYVVGTDGRHLFSSNSFTLPLKAPLIIPNHRFLAWRDFNGDDDWKLRVSDRSKEHVAQFELASGNWRFIAQSFDGNYPNWRAVQLPPGSARTTIEFEPGKISDIVQTIARLPNHDTSHFTIGVEVRGGVTSLLSKSANADQWSRLELPGAKATGIDSTIYFNRNLLSKALRFEMLRLEIVDGLSPGRFVTGGRQMIVMPVRSASPTAASTSIQSPEEESRDEKATQAETQTKETPQPAMAESASKSIGSPSIENIAEKSALELALNQVETVRASFRSLMPDLQKLADLLKQAQRESKASEKEISSVRATLRSLQTVRI